MNFWAITGRNQCLNKNFKTRKIILPKSFLFDYIWNMSRNKKKPKRIAKSNMILKQGPTTAKIKLQLDERTTVTVHHLSALKIWKVKYPDAKVIENRDA